MDRIESCLPLFLMNRPVLFVVFFVDLVCSVCVLYIIGVSFCVLPVPFVCHMSVICVSFVCLVGVLCVPCVSYLCPFVCVLCVICMSFVCLVCVLCVICMSLCVLCVSFGCSVCFVPILRKSCFSITNSVKFYS